MKRLLTLGILLLCWGTQGTNYTNTSLVVGDIQILINSSGVVAGDTIYLANGTGNWGSTLTINKAISLIGYGTNATTINGENLIVVASSGVRISGIKFMGLNPSSLGATCCPSIDVSGHRTGVRIDNCFFYGNGRTITTGSTGGSYLFGVIDHNTFVNCDVAIGVNGDNIFTHFPQVPGSTNSVCIEDNRIYMNGAFASSYAGEPIYHQWAAHSIIRKNTIDLTGYNSNGSDFIDAHGNVIGGSDPVSEQGTVIVECYSNNFVGGNGLSILANLRGGCMIWWSNTFTQSYTLSSTMRLMEEDGWKFNFLSSWPGYQQITNSFFWGNYYNGNLCQPTIYDCGCSPPQTTFIQLGRDYWTHPILSTNIFYPYTPLAYPHPLISGGSTTNPPSITQNPVGVTNWSGITLQLSVSASGSSPLSYQWRLMTNNVAGQTGASFSSNNVQTTSTGWYDCVVLNPNGSITSSPVYVLITNAVPYMSSNPMGVTNYIGSSISLTSVVSGSPTISYQWRLNTNAIGGANAATYTKANVTISDQGWYDVLAANSFGSVTSAPAYVSLSTNNNIPPGLVGNGSTGAAASWNSLVLGPVTSSGANRILLYYGYNYDVAGEVVTNVTFNTSEQFTLLARTNYYDQFGVIDLWYLINPSVNTANVLVNGNSLDEVAGRVMLVTNVNQSSPFEAVSMSFVQNGSPVTSDTLTPTQTTNELVIDALVSSGALWNPSATLIGNINAPNGTFFCDSQALGTSPATSMSWNGASDMISHIAVAIKPAAGQPVVPPGVKVVIHGKMSIRGKASIR